MSKYTERIERFENDEKKKKLTFGLIIALLIAIFLGGMVIGLQNILNQEGTYDPASAEIKKVEVISAEKGKVLSDFSASLEKTRDFNSVKLSVNTNVDIPDDSIIVSGSESEEIKLFIKHIKPKVLEAVKEFYGSYDGKFGVDWSEHIIHSDLTPAEVVSAEEKTGRLDGEAVVDTDTVFFDIKPDVKSADAERIEKNTGADLFESVKSSALGKINELGDITGFSAEFLDFEIHGEADAKTGNAKRIKYTRSYSVSVTLAFSGDLKALGTRNIGFVFTAEENHEYTYAGLRFSKHEISMEKGKTEALEAFRTADEEVKLTWVSSDPEIASVDDRGYIKGHKTSASPVTITAEFSYLGKTYTDSCEVLVRTPVEEIKTTPKKITIAPGGQAELSAELYPKKATVRDIMWFTEDGSIAEVDENGTVTGKRSGQTKVFAVAKDGFLRSSCTVTVTDK